jgi:hypothetical protein
LKVGAVHSRCGAVSRAIWLGLAGLLVAISLAGCWDDSMTTSQIAREEHTATLLSDGRVLIAGGWDARFPTVAASAALYDPKSGTFSPTGAMATARAGHTATLLPDGRVLVAGGRRIAGANAWLAVASAELYDPKTGTFSATGPLATARQYHAATLLTDGRVLIAGGLGNSTLITAELYDPATGTFSPAGSLSADPTQYSVIALSSGRALLVGIDGSAWLYDPANGTLSPTGSMATTHWYDTATLLSDGRVLMAGGTTGGKVVASAELYDPKTGKFSPTGSMATAREYHTATLLSNGRVLIAGGDSGERGPDSPLPLALASAELYDPATGAFSATGSMAPATP